MNVSGRTPYPELDEVLCGHAQKLKLFLGEKFTGYYLQGSLALGDFDLSSDIDFIVVIEKELSENEVAGVQRIHSELYERKNRLVKRLEYSFFPKEKLKIFSSPFINTGKRNDNEERKLWYFDNGSKDINKDDHCNTLVTRRTLCEKGIAILGPNIKKFIPLIKPSILREEIKNTMIGWSKEIMAYPKKYKNRFYQSYLVLNYCRMLHDLYKGEVSSKPTGVKWAKENLDPKWHRLIDFCSKERQDLTISIKQPADNEIFKKTIEFVGYIVNLAEDYRIR